MKVERIAEPILVTGATGFIGRRLVARLRREKYRVRALVLPGEPLPRAFDDDVEVVRGDVTRSGEVDAAVGGAKTVFHLAAMVGDWGLEEIHQKVTVGGTENVLRAAAREDARVLLASSIVVYGHHIGQVVCDEHLPMGEPQGPYSRAKQAQEHLALQLEASDGLRVTIIRPSNVTGPGSVPWVEETVKALKQGLPALIGGGDLAAGLTYVDNVVDVFVRAAERPGAIGRVYNANDDDGITWRRYFGDLARLVGAPKPRAIPRRIAAALAASGDRAWKLLRRSDRPPLTREALNLVGSHHRVPADRARRELGHQPIVTYDEAMTAIADDLAKRGLRAAS